MVISYFLFDNRVPLLILQYKDINIL